MNINFKRVFIGLVIGLAFFLGCEYGAGSAPPAPIGSDTITVTKTDTIRDTVTVHDFKYKTKWDTVVEVYSYERPIDTNKLNAFFKVRYYENYYRDSINHITVGDSVVGYLIGQKVKYRHLAPLSIVNSTTTSVTNTVSVKPPNWEFKIGADFTPKNMYLNGELEVGRNSYSGGIDPFNKGPWYERLKVGYKRTILRSKK